MFKGGGPKKRQLLHKDFLEKKYLVQHEPGLFTSFFLIFSSHIIVSSFFLEIFIDRLLIIVHNFANNIKIIIRTGIIYQTRL